MVASYREIEVNVFSAHDLRDVRIFGGKMSPYVVAWVHHDLKAYSPVDVKGSTDPTWNAKLLLYCNEAALDHPDEAVVYIELHDAASASDRLIGALSYPLSEPPQLRKQPSDAVFLNLPVRRPSGREQGVLNFALKMGGVTRQPIPQDEPAVHPGNAAMAPAHDHDDDETVVGGCCVLPHFPRDDHTFHRTADVGPNVVAH